MPTGVCDATGAADGGPAPASMRTRGLRPAAAAALCLAALAGRPAPVAATTYADLRPLLEQHCLVCHTGEAAPVGLRLDSHAAILQGSRNGPVVRSGDPAGSELIRRIRGSSLPRMPMTGPPFLSDSEIAAFERWVAGGLQPGTAAAAASPPHDAPGVPGPGESVTFRHVAPIFATRCAKCHTEQGLMGPAPEGYLLTSYLSALTTHDRMRIVPGKADASELIRRIRGQARPRMPLDGPPYLSDEEIRLIEDWVRQGARDAAGQAAGIPAGAAVRLHGRLEPGWRLDGLPLAVDSNTRLDKHPQPGDAVQVRGRLDATGNVRAERIRPR